MSYRRLGAVQIRWFVPFGEKFGKDSPMRFSLCAAVAAVVFLSSPAPATDYTQLGPYLVGNQTISVARTAGGSGSFNSRIFYPAVSAGANTAVDGAGGPYPVVVFAHGYATDPIDEYSLTAAHLASYGYLVVLPQSYTSVLDVLNTAALGNDMTSVYNHLVAQNSSGSSSFFNLVDASGYAAMGHSMGGAASISEASQANRPVRTVVGWGTQNMQIPNANSQLPNVRVPIQYVAGTQDGIVSSSTTQALYNNANPPAILNNLIGGFHFGFEDVGDSIFADSGSMSRAVQLAYSRSLSVQWLDLYMKGDQSVWREFWGPEALDDSNILFSRKSGIGLTAITPTYLEGAPGSILQYDLVVQNNGVVATSYTLFVEDNDFLANFSTATTAVLNPGQQAVVTVNVHLPGGYSYGLFDDLLFSVRNDHDGGTRNYVFLQAAVVPEAGSALLAGLGGLAAAGALRLRRRR